MPKNSTQNIENRNGGGERRKGEANDKGYDIDNDFPGGFPGKIS